MVKAEFGQTSVARGDIVDIRVFTEGIPDSETIEVCLGRRVSENLLVPWRNYRYSSKRSTCGDANRVSVC